jgi:hypothetical protein
MDFYEIWFSWRLSPRHGAVSGCGRRRLPDMEGIIIFFIGWDWGHCLAYCTSPRWQMITVEQSVERELAEEPEVLGGNVPQCHDIEESCEYMTKRSRTSCKGWSSSLGVGLTCQHKNKLVTKCLEGLRACTMWIGLIWLRTVTSGGLCEHSNELSGSVTCWKVLE